MCERSIFMETKNSRIKKVRGSCDVSHLGQSIDSMISDFMLEENIDGLALAIVQAPYISRITGYGVSDKKQNRLVSANTMWPIGPISQAFAAIAIMQLHESNMLSVDEPIGIYLPDVPSAWHAITILDLLRHASGIVDYRKHKAFSLTKKWKFEELLALVKMEDLRFPAGTAVDQSATNFLLLTEIIERVSGMSYHDFITQKQIAYLGLQHTGFFEDVEHFAHENVSLSANVHQLFKADNKYIDPIEPAISYCEEKAIPFIDSTALRGFSDIWASAQDISFWDIALAGSVLIHDIENRKKIYAPWHLPDHSEVPAVAGWRFYKHRGFMDSKGSIAGYSGFLSRFTDAKELVCVTLLANKEGVDFTNLARRIASAYTDLIASKYNDNEQFLMESQFSVKKTIERLEKALKKRDIPIFAKFDHADNARNVELDLRPTTVLVFGSPQVGTLLMQDNQSFSMELPLRIAVWEDENGSVWLGFPRILKVAENYQLNEYKIIKNMQKLLESLTYSAAHMYE